METRFFEETYRKWKVIPQSRFVCEITAVDASSFGMIFSTATEKLKKWHDQNRSKAVEFELRLSGNEKVLERAQYAIKTLMEAEGTYYFVKKLKVVIVYQDVTTGQVEHYDYVKPEV